MLEGLRPRRIPTFPALSQPYLLSRQPPHREYRWLVLPDDNQEQRIDVAETAFTLAPAPTPLLAAARGLHAWIIDRGGERQAGRAALIRFWRQRRLLREPFPLTGTAALRADTPCGISPWTLAFLKALAEEAQKGLQLLMTLEQAWFTARRATAKWRSTSRAAARIDVLAAAPLVSATSLGQALDIGVKHAAKLLDEFLPMASLLKLRIVQAASLCNFCPRCPAR